MDKDTLPALHRKYGPLGVELYSRIPISCPCHRPQYNRTLKVIPFATCKTAASWLFLCLRNLYEENHVHV